MYKLTRIKADRNGSNTAAAGVCLESFDCLRGRFTPKNQDNLRSLEYI